MKVLHLISSGGMYGAEAVILNLSRALNATGEHSSLLGVFANSGHPTPQLHQVALAAGIDSHLISCRGQLDRSVPSSLRSLIQGTGADLIHAHGYKADVYAWLALRRAGVPLVSTCHTWYDNDFAVRLYGALDRRTLRSFDGVVAVSEDVRQRLLRAGVAASRVHLIRNGIDLHPFAAAPALRRQTRPADGALRIGLVGRLSVEKGIDLFLQAAAQVVAHHPGTRFFIAGDGSDRASLQDLITHLGLGTTATLLGRLDNMPAFYGSLDLIVSASRQEGLPIALLESMASGLPVVATSVGAVPQVIRNGETGLLVPSGEPSTLAAAIVRLIADVDLRHSLAAAGQGLIAAEFSSVRMAADYLALYANVLTERKNRRAV
jgi:glycosyltransferase involved in cell wall biosynthesis